jgi:hypothetical protein
MSRTKFCIRAGNLVTGIVVVWNCENTTIHINSIGIQDMFSGSSNPGLYSTRNNIAYPSKNSGNNKGQESSFTLPITSASVSSSTTTTFSKLQPKNSMDYPNLQSCSVTVQSEKSISQPPVRLPADILQLIQQAIPKPIDLTLGMYEQKSTRYDLRVDSFGLCD